MSSEKQTIVSAPYALAVPGVDSAQLPTAGGAVKEEVIADGSIAPAAAPVKRKLDPAEEAKLREMEYKKRYVV